MKIEAFLSLSEGDTVQFRGKTLTMTGPQDLIDHKEPVLIDEDGRVVNGAIYAAHLMTYLGPDPHYKAIEPTVPAEATMGAQDALGLCDYNEAELVAWEKNQLI